MDTDFLNRLNKFIISEKNTVETVMASNISHELKNYLVPLQGYIILLQKQVDNLQNIEFKEKTEKYFSIINNQILKLDWLSKSLGVVSRSSDLGYKPVNLNNLIIDSVKLVYDVAAKYAGYELFFDKEYNNDKNRRKILVHSYIGAPLVNGDVYSLSQLLISLLTNALNSLDGKNEAVIEVGMKRLEESKEFGIFVKDTGTGLRDDIKQYAFEPYLTTIDKDGFGTGMGFVRITASRHDARIEFSSELSKGTEVVIWFPPEEQIFEDIK